MINENVLKKVGSGIKKLRNKTHESQEVFADSIGIARQTLSAMEHGKASARFDLIPLLRICEKCECDIDFLIGNIKERTHDLAFICEYTGLREETILYLHELNQAKQDWIEAQPEEEPDEWPQFDIFEKLLSSGRFFSISRSIYDYKDNFKPAKAAYSREIKGERRPGLVASLGYDYELKNGDKLMREAQFAIMDAQYKITEFAYSNFGNIDELKELQKKAYIENESRKEG